MFLNLAAPVVLEHPINNDLAEEYAVVPGLAGGGLLRGLLNKVHGTLVNGPSWAGALGRPGGYGSLAFDGVDDKVTFTPFSLAGGAVTYALWVRLAVVGDSIRRTFIGNKHTLFTYNGVTQVEWWPNTNTTVIGAEMTPAAGRWYHFAVTQDAAGNYAMYVDGQLVKSGVTVALNDAAESNSIGVFGPATDWALSGNMDGMLIFPRALSAGEVWTLFTESRLGNPSRWRWIQSKAISVILANDLLLQRRKYDLFGW